MTLDEAIKHAEEVAEAKLQDAELSEIQGCYNTAKKCAQCAEEHRQLAEWLKELKRLREQADVLDTNVGELISKDAVLDLVANYDLSMGEVVRGIHDLPSFTLQPKKRTEERTETRACDYISRQAVLDLFAEKCDAVRPYHEVWQAVKELPSVEPERKTGKWIRGEAYPHHIYCSECYKTFIPNDELRAWANGDLPRKYCPNCGTKMDVDE